MGMHVNCRHCKKLKIVAKRVFGDKWGGGIYAPFWNGHDEQRLKEDVKELTELLKCWYGSRWGEMK
jgi:hypothetical protein